MPASTSIRRRSCSPPTAPSIRGSSATRPPLSASFRSSPQPSAPSPPMPGARAGADHRSMTGRTHTQRVLVVGGGVAGLETILALRSLAPGLVDVELLAPEHHFWYRPLAVAEPFGLGTAGSFELAALAAEAGAQFTPGELERVDTARKVAVTTHGAELEYDALVIAAGARPEPALRGALTFRGPADSDAFRALLRAAESGLVERIAFALPAGNVWPLPLYELALMTARRLQEVARADTSLAFVTHEQAPAGPLRAGRLARGRGVARGVRDLPLHQPLRRRGHARGAHRRSRRYDCGRPRRLAPAPGRPRDRGAPERLGGLPPDRRARARGRVRGRLRVRRRLGLPRQAGRDRRAAGRRGRAGDRRRCRAPTSSRGRSGRSCAASS